MPGLETISTDQLACAMSGGDAAAAARAAEAVANLTVAEAEAVLQDLWQQDTAAAMRAALAVLQKRPDAGAPEFSIIWQRLAGAEDGELRCAALEAVTHLPDNAMPGSDSGSKTRTRPCACACSRGCWS